MNNRQLKFRAWDKLAKQFTYPDKGYQGHYVLDLNGRFQNLQNGSGSDEYVVQQFTGEYDKNEKEIYEGDIVKCEKPEIWLMEDFDKREAGIITYFNAAFHVAEKYTGGPIKGSIRLIKYRSIVDPYRLECEVIGNVFENSELLNNE
jgi:uncharacterized phage protein (TIGR01671 family)